MPRTRSSNALKPTPDEGEPSQSGARRNATPSRDATAFQTNIGEGQVSGRLSQHAEGTGWHNCPAIGLDQAGTDVPSGRRYGSVVSRSTTARSGGAGGRPGMTKLSINTRTPKRTKPHAPRLRIPTPIEIDMKAMILKTRFPLICSVTFLVSDTPCAALACAASGNSSFEIRSRRLR